LFFLTNNVFGRGKRFISYEIFKDDEEKATSYSNMFLSKKVET
jgi:hypothetical protein